MNRRVLALAGLGGLAACTGEPRYQYQGYQVYEHFPLDGDRNWKYSQDDKKVKWLLEVDKVQPSEVVGDHEIVTLDYSRGDTGDLLYSVKWSSDSSDGVLIHAFTETGGEDVTFDPPIVFGGYQMASGDSVSTSTNEGDYTATFVAIEGCPNHWVSDWDCIHISLEGTGRAFEGEYWIAPRYGTSLFQPTGYEQNWNLLEAYWAEEAKE